MAHHRAPLAAGGHATKANTDATSHRGLLFSYVGQLAAATTFGLGHSRGGMLIAVVYGHVLITGRLRIALWPGGCTTAWAWAVD